MSEDFHISTDKGRLDIPAIHAFLSKRSYWAKDRTLATVQKCIENSLTFGMYDSDSNMVGFGRVVTDFTVFAFIMDVFILEEYRGRGLGKKLIDHIVNHPHLKNLKRWQLLTADAHGLYHRYGFKALAAPEKHLERVDKQCR